MTKAIPNSDEITLQDFNETLAKYESVVKTVSDAKGVKSGQSSLGSLDDFRYNEAPNFFGSDKKRKQMALEDVKLLVEWKLRHGKFRPMLMKLVSSNDAGTVKDTIQEAMETYKARSDASAAVKILTKLKGIGPATASLLLAVHDPDHVIFFGDEVFYWLCCDGKISPIKYNAKEYQELDAQAKQLIKRLRIRAIDAERVAFVLLKEQDAAPMTGAPRVKAQSPDPPLVSRSTSQPAKRKQGSGDVAKTTPDPRRSKRGKQA